MIEKKHLMWLIAIAVVAGLMGGAAVEIFYHSSASVVAAEAGGGAKGISEFVPSNTSLASVAAKVMPYVVTITSEKTYLYREQSPFPFEDPFFRRFFGGAQAPRYHEFKQKGLGSGVIVSPDGYILTNAHVVDDADEVTVWIDEDKYDAKVVGADKKSDLAVLKIDKNGLPAAPLGDSDKLRVGDWVLAVGNPYELRHTVSVGIISGKGRSNVGILDYENFLQTDAAINPGNSGGALVDLQGELVGINTAIVSQTGGWQGIGFAIPINMAKKVMEDIITEGKVTRGWLGVYIQDITQDIAKGLDIDDNTDGVLISSVAENSPAENANLKQGDIITAVDGRDVHSSSDLRNYIAMTPPGQKVKLDILRNGKEKEISVKLGELPSEEEALPSDKAKKLGFTVEKMTPDLADKYDYPKGTAGVVVTSVNYSGFGADIGLREGDVILEVNRNKIETVAQFEDALSNIETGDVVLFLVRRGNMTIYLAGEMTNENK